MCACVSAKEPPLHLSFVPSATEKWSHRHFLFFSFYGVKLAINMSFYSVSVFFSSGTMAQRGGKVPMKKSELQRSYPIAFYRNLG